MRLRTANSVENPVTQAVTRASQAANGKMVSDAWAPLKQLEPETMFPTAVRLLAAETRRPRRAAYWVAGCSLGPPLVLLVILLLTGMPFDKAIYIAMGLGCVTGMGIPIAFLLWWQVTSRWLLTRQAALQLLPRLTDPRMLSHMIELAWLSRRRCGPQITAVLEDSLVRLLSRFDPELDALALRERERLIALTARGGDELQIAALLTLGSLNSPEVRPLAQKLSLPGQSERVQAAARECLEALAA